MEQSKSISIMISKFKIAYPYYFKDLTDNQLLGMVKMYHEELSSYDEDVINDVTKSVIRTSKYMPSLSELIDECERFKTRNRYLLIDKMQKDGYFKDLTEIAKAHQYLSTGIIPSWFLEDLKKYGYKGVNNEYKGLPK